MVVAAFRLATGITGAIVAIESLLLYLGTHWLAQEPSPWAVPKNDAFAVVDVAAGAYLVYAAVRGDLGPASALFYGLVAISLVTHGYRIWEYLAGVEAPFFFNGPLFAFGLLRLAGLIVCLLLSLWLPVTESKLHGFLTTSEHGYGTLVQISNRSVARCRR